MLFSFSHEGQKYDLDALELLEIAERAGNAILNIYHSPDDWEVEFKGPKDPVTAADKAAHDVIKRSLDNLKSFPRIPLLSEEGELPSFDVRKKWTLYWCVDPLDGTKEFIKKTGDFTVNIALVKDSKPVFGVITVPVTKEAAFAAESLGSYYRPNDQEPFQKIICQKAQWNQTGLHVMASSNHVNAPTRKYIQRFTDPTIRNRGSSLKFLEVARGEAACYPRLGPTYEWDTCAGQVIVEQAGGSAVQFSDEDESSGAPLEYNKENLLNPSFLVLADFTG